MSQQESRQHELGARRDGETTHFEVYSAEATAIELCLFNEGRERRIPMLRGDDAVWHLATTDAGPGQLYGYRADGPWNPQEGLRFDATKLLMDPMARAITGEPQMHPALVDHGVDSAEWMPRSVVVDGRFDWQDDQPPRTPWGETVIYECHVRGMTQLHPQVDEALRGTYLGLASPPILDHLKSLGVTAVELLPVHQIASEPHLQRRGLRNYWGYSPLGFCAPHAGYASGGHGEQVDELKTMVRELHRAGLEVLIDVVFNHTAEVDHGGPVLCWRGLDNRTYYRLQPEDPSRYLDSTGCGHTFDFGSPAVRRQILDCLRLWVRDFHIDGFRFDLATVLGRDDSATFDPQAAFFAELADDPELADVKLIAEPWDIGHGGYQVGNFPAGWGEWNDKFRDTVRSFWRGDPGTLGDLATRFAGSRDLFGTTGPLRSINYVACHDGFTLNDLVSYEHRHNLANGEDNRDGNPNNRSRNWGHEGPTDDPSILTLRAQARRNLIATLAFSQGVPMILHGDEIGRSQGGNNNAYCQDNEVAWVDWSAADSHMLAFFRRVLAIRRRFPALRRAAFPGTDDLTWWHPEGREMTHDDWATPGHQAVVVGVRDPSGTDGDLLLFVNGGEHEVSFALPLSGISEEGLWHELIDTATQDEVDTPRGHVSRIVVGPSSLRLFALG